MGKHDQLKRDTWMANQLLHDYGLVIHTWGNVSQRSKDGKLFAIKPSGVSYDLLRWEDIVVLDLDGQVVEGDLRPSSDTPTHAALYKYFNELQGITHDHSTYGTSWAQAGRGIPSLGTTHADTFYGTIPCTRSLTKQEVDGAYEANTAKSIIEAFVKADKRHSVASVPGILVNNHGVFAFSTKNGIDSVNNALTLEEVAKMATISLQILPSLKPIPQYIADRHYFRKHGDKAYYGQASTPKKKGK